MHRIDTVCIFFFNHYEHTGLGVCVCTVESCVHTGVCCVKYFARDDCCCADRPRQQQPAGCVCVCFSSSVLWFGTALLIFDAVNENDQSWTLVQ